RVLRSCNISSCNAAATPTIYPLSLHDALSIYLEMIREINDLDIFWVEIDTLDPKALAYIRSQSNHPIASCETLLGVQQFLPFFRSEENTSEPQSRENLVCRLLLEKKNKYMYIQ